MTWADLDKLAAAKPRPDGSPTLVVRDDRTLDQIVEARPLSIIVAISRVLRARRVLADKHGGRGTVVYLTARTPPEPLIDAVTAAGGVVFDGTREHVARSPLATSFQLDAAFSDLGSAVRRRLGARSFLAALETFEWELRRKQPDRADNAWWIAIIELAAVTGECIREKRAAKWIESPAHRLPLGLDLGKGNVLLPGQLAQTIVEGGDVSMRSLFEIAEPPTIVPIRPGATVMPLLCDRRAVPIEQLTWERLISEQVDTDDVPVIVYVEDHGGTIKWPFGPTEPTGAQRARALANLAKEPFEIEAIVAPGGHTMVVVTGGYYASEAMLVPEVMNRVGSHLGGTRMMQLGVPARGHTIAVDAVKANLDDEFQQVFLRLVEKHYLEATERDRISSEVILYLDKPVGRVQSNLMDARKLLRGSGVDPDA